VTSAGFAIVTFHLGNTLVVLSACLAGRDTASETKARLTRASF
jgi:hypothetical protein